MDTRESIERIKGRITFPKILWFIAGLYVVGFFITGQLLLQLPTNWFVTWLSSIFKVMDDVGFFNVWSGLTQGNHYLYFFVWKPAQAISGGHLDVAVAFSVLWFLLSTGALFLSAYYFYKLIAFIQGEPKALVLGIIYLVIFLTFQWFIVIDSIAIVAMLAAIYYYIKGSWKLGGVLLGICVVIKPIGLMLLPVFIMSEFISKKGRVLFTAAFALTFSGLLLPFVIGNFDIFMSTVNWQSGRPPWESVYAFSLWAAKVPFTPNPFFLDYSGVTQLDWGWAGITPTPSIMATPVPHFNSWYNSVFTVLMLITLVVFFISKRIRSTGDFLWGGIFTIGMYAVLFYGWSDQFYFWLTPFFLACFPIAISFFFKIAAWLEYPLFYGLHLARIAPDLVTSVLGMPQSWTLALATIGTSGFWTLVILRTVFILVLSIIAWNKLLTQFRWPALKIRVTQMRS